MYTNGARVLPPIVQTPYEIVVTTNKVELPPQTIQIEYDNDGLHFLTDWGMVSINKDNVKEGEIVETSNAALPPLHDTGVSQ